MLQAVSSEAAKRNRKKSRGRTSGHEQWRTTYFGPEVEQYEGHPKAPVLDVPQAFLDEITPNAVLTTHFHQVDQFTVLLGGSASVGRHPLSYISLYYNDRCTAYGPLKSGPYGMTLFTLRPQSDPGGIHVHKPGYKDFLKSSRQRFLFADICLTVAPVLRAQSNSVIEPLFSANHCDDGLGATMLRLGAGLSLSGPNPAMTATQYYLILSGSLELLGASYPAWSLIHVATNDCAVELRAGPDGLEALLMSFPLHK